MKNNGWIDAQVDYLDTSSAKGKNGKCKTNKVKVVKITDYMNMLFLHALGENATIRKNLT